MSNYILRNSTGPTMYPYYSIIGSECEFITLFHGDDYTLVRYEVGFGWFGSKIAHSVTHTVSSAGHFASNAVKCAGREIGHASHTLQNIEGQISKGIGKIPLVGTPLHTIFDVSYHMTMAPYTIAISVAIEGKRIDKVALDNLKQELHDFKQVAPYAQMVISIVPGIGQGVSAALSAGLALAEGQSIEEAIKAGVIGAIPGGPLVKAAITMSVETIQHVAKGDKLTLQTFAQTAGGIASSALGLPIAAKNALVTGMSVVGGITSGKPLDKILIDATVIALPISDQAKKGMNEATILALDLASGKRLDTAMTSRLNATAAMLPITNPLHDSIKTALDASKKLGGGKGEEVMHGALQAGITDSLVSMGAQPLPSDTQKGLKAGIALGSGSFIQGQRKTQLNKVSGKLVQSGVQIAKASPLFAEARKIAASKGATQGFDQAAGLLQQQVGTGDIAHVRDSLNVTQKIGFDIACSVRIGAVANPKPPTLSPAAHAGHAITLGMQSYTPDKKAVLMQTIQSNSSATVGATVAVKEVATNRESFLSKLLKAFGINPSKK